MVQLTKGVKSRYFELLSRVVCYFVIGSTAHKRLPKVEQGRSDIGSRYSPTSTLISCVLLTITRTTHFLVHHLQKVTHSMIHDFSTIKIVVLGSFNVHNKEWFASPKTDCQGRATESVVISNSLTYLATEPTHFSRVLLTIIIPLIYISRVTLSNTRSSFLLLLDAPIMTVQPFHTLSSTSSQKFPHLASFGASIKPTGIACVNFFRFSMKLAKKLDFRKTKISKNRWTI